jgi:hypothetical protein
MKAINVTKLLYTAAVAALLPLTGCMQDDTIHIVDTAEGLNATAVYVGETNTTIAGVKQTYSSVFSNNNTFRKVTEDVIFEGVVVANDYAENLYQTTFIMDGEDGFCIPVKNMKAFPYLQLGQRIKVNCKDLYIGNYSYVPRVGEPYYTSAGNLRLGPMLAQQCATNIELVGEPDTTAAELTPFVPSASWLADSKNMTYLSFPRLASITGFIAEANGEATWAPDDLKDAGYGVNRTLVTLATNIIVRNSTSSEFATRVIPKGTVTITGILTCYGGGEWQILMRDENDLHIH